MEERILIGGLGGQGVLVIGKVLSHACVLEGKEIVYMEEYGDSVRAELSVALSSYRVN